MQDIKNYNGTKFFIIGHCLTTRCRFGKIRPYRHRSAATVVTQALQRKKKYDGIEIKQRMDDRLRR